MREIRRYDGNVNSEIPENICPSTQGSREYPKTYIICRDTVGSVTRSKSLIPLGILRQSLVIDSKNLTEIGEA